MRSFIRGLKSLWYWLPVIWRVRPWSYMDVFELLQHQLAWMERSFASSKAMSVGSDRHAREMRRALLLLDRLIKDDYFSNAFVEHERTWGEMEMDFSRPLPERYGCCVLHTWYPRADGWKEQGIASDQAGRLYRHAEKVKAYDMRYLGEWLGKHLLQWWD